MPNFSKIDHFWGKWLNCWILAHNSDYDAIFSWILMFSSIWIIFKNYHWFTKSAKWSLIKAASGGHFTWFLAPKSVNLDLTVVPNDIFFENLFKKTIFYHTNATNYSFSWYYRTYDSDDFFAEKWHLDV